MEELQRLSFRQKVSGKKLVYVVQCRANMDQKSILGGGGGGPLARP